MTDGGKFFDDQVLPCAVEDVERREAQDDSHHRGPGRSDHPVVVPGNHRRVPASSPKQGVDDAVYGVAIWEVNDDIAKADTFQIYVRGLSNGSFADKLDDNTPIVRYKTLRLDFASPGDERDPNESEIRLLDPPYHWEVPDPLNARQKPKSAADVKVTDLIGASGQSLVGRVNPARILGRNEDWRASTARHVPHSAHFFQV